MKTVGVAGSPPPSRAGQSSRWWPGASQAARSHAPPPSRLTARLRAAARGTPRKETRVRSAPPSAPQTFPPGSAAPEPPRSHPTPFPAGPWPRGDPPQGRHDPGPPSFAGTVHGVGGGTGRGPRGWEGGPHAPARNSSAPPPQPRGRAGGEGPWEPRGPVGGDPWCEPLSRRRNQTA